ncbi:hypothetical protein PC118_g628 [Phytophthora cactorum]|uniref:RNase NYN domain-containing protein n=1 Tax=Phytophthora cactorum TaxID=29920 RepID=A0A8T1GM58_9STRA|nr:hypothetical protein PC118_g628 [Phytophthora cactorum]KAG3039674.1 hypothetical protein PC119_g2023 [Phytophthora cactorum]
MAAVEECVVVIDGANVACQKDGKAHIPKLAAAIKLFRSLESAAGQYPVKCVAFAPNFWLNVKPTPSSAGPRENAAMETDDWALLNELVQKDHVILTPSQAHDDFYVIDYAVKYNGFIVTNDMFRDHVSNKRTFHGKRLTSNWPSAIDSLPSAMTPSSTNSRLQKTQSNDEIDVGADDDVNEDGMVVDHKGGETMEKFQEYTGTYIVLPSHTVSVSPSARPLPNVLTLSIYGPEASRQQAVGHLDAFLLQMQQQAQYEFQQQQQQYMASQVHQAGMYPQQQQPYAPGNGTQDDHMMEIDPY